MPGALGRINLRIDTATTMSFCLVDSATGATLAPAALAVTFVDFDSQVIAK